MISFYFLLKEELCNMYPKWFSPIVHLLIITFNLLFYWYFTQAIEPKTEYLHKVNSSNYFWFIIIGEISLVVPLKLLSKPSQNIKNLYMRNLLDEFLCLNKNFMSYLNQLTYCQILLELSKLIIITTLLITQGFIPDMMTLLSLVSLQLIFFPLFISLGYLAAYIVLYFGRGEKIVQLLVSVLFILAGTYFPVEVLPFNLNNLLNYSPLNILVTNTRALLSGEDIFNLLTLKHGIILSVGLTLWGLLHNLFSYFILHVDRPLSHKPLINHL